MITRETISSPIADSVPIVILQTYKADDFKIPEISQKPSETCLVRFTADPITPREWENRG